MSTSPRVKPPSANPVAPSLGRRRQPRGSTLFVCLALLLALAAGGVAVAQTATLELRMARAEREAAFAFHAAEAALREAEAWVEANAASPATLFIDRDGLYAQPAYGQPPPWLDDHAWAPGNSRAASVPSGTAIQSRYMVEWLATLVDRGAADNPLPATTIDIFRITARSVGAAPATLQTTYARTRSGPPRPLAGRISWLDLGI